MRVKYEEAKDVEILAKHIAEIVGFDHLDFSRIRFIRSRGSSSNAIARCYGLERIWQLALNTKAHYIVEVLSEKYDKLPEEEKIKTIIHELMHIPKSFGGGLRGHNYVNRRNVEKVYRIYKKRMKELSL